jgi:hypothetical protein
MSKVTEIWGKVSDFISGAQNVTNTRPVRSTSIIKYEQSLTRMKQDVGKWRRALIAAESNLNPNRTEYYRMIKDILVDAHLPR